MSDLNWATRVCAVFLLWATTAIALPAQTLTTLYSFIGPDGSGPSAGLVQGFDGNFYGTTYLGGANSGCEFGSTCGTVFKITPGGTLTTLHSFSGTDGGNPYSGLIQAFDGDFYGTTLYGGVSGFCTDQYGCGTLFRMTPNGTLTTIYNFCSVTGCTDGDYPYAGLVQGSDGNFYGTTYSGGTSIYYGTVFKITPGGTLTTLFNFDYTNGAYPLGALIQTANGVFYGTTSFGGTQGRGTIFKITPSGTLTTLLSIHAIQGLELYGALVQGANGDFYGTTYEGGTYDDGTVYDVTPAGKLTTLYSFNYSTGRFSQAGLVKGTDGNFYGTTSDGGLYYGTVFEITPSGAFTVLHNFAGTDGEKPDSALIQGTDGSFYGTTPLGGDTSLCMGEDYSGCGTVFSLSTGLGPFAETLPAFGKVGAQVKILGYKMTGATSVTFNGTPATFTVVSSSLITTTVPAGATSGKVHVFTPQGNLSSNVPFRVKP